METKDFRADLDTNYTSAEISNIDEQFYVTVNGELTDHSYGSFRQAVGKGKDIKQAVPNAVVIIGIVIGGYDLDGEPCDNLAIKDILEVA